MAFLLQPGDDEILAMCAPSPPATNGIHDTKHDIDGTAARTEILPMGCRVVSPDSQPDMSGSVITVTNSELQIGTKINLSPNTNGGAGLPRITVGGSHVVLCRTNGGAGLPRITVGGSYVVLCRKIGGTGLIGTITVGGSQLYLVALGLYQRGN